MFFYRNPPKILYKSNEEESVLQQLSDYLDSHMSSPALILARLWKDQQAAVTYRDIREAIRNGDISEELMEAWIQDYSRMAADSFLPAWMQAAEAGAKSQPATQELAGYAFNPREKGVRKWAVEHAGEFITSISESQRQAVRAMIGRSVDGRYTVDELSRVIRPCVGLNQPQAEANLRYYETVRDDLLENHPRMTAESAQQQAREKALKYAERQHRQRAYMIAETELAAAYNGGNELTIQQAQKQGKLGAVRRIGSTADDERVCTRCASKHGKEIPAEDGIPPWHPRCRCAIAYEPIEEPAPEVVDAPDYLRVDDRIPEAAYEEIQKEWDLIPPKHQAILEEEIVGIWRSPYGNSKTDKRYGLIYMADELDEGEFIHEAAHLLEEHFQVYQDETYLTILKESIIDRSGKIIVATDDSFVKPIQCVLSDKLVSKYQGRWYDTVPIFDSDKRINPYAFSDFFAEGYRSYILEPQKLERINPRLFDYMKALAG